MKRIGIGLALLIVFIVVFYGGLHGFGRYIYNTKSCKQFNIDNIELRTGINIPAVTTTECQCVNNKKISKFLVDTKKVDLDDYVSRNDFTRIDSLYIKENDNQNSTYKITFNKKTAELLVDLTYKNN